jgi:hypothetical protein
MQTPNITDFTHTYEPSVTTEDFPPGWEDGSFLTPAPINVATAATDGGRRAFGAGAGAGGGGARVQFAAGTVLDSPPAVKTATTTTAKTAPPSHLRGAGDEDDEDDDDEDFSAGLEATLGAVERAHSPVILWRNSARVKLAQDVPAELRSVFLATAADSSSPTTLASPTSPTGPLSPTSQPHAPTAPLSPTGRPHDRRATAAATTGNGNNILTSPTARTHPQFGDKYKAPASTATGTDSTDVAH